MITQLAQGFWELGKSPSSFSGSKNLKLVAVPLSDSALPISAATPFAWVGFLRAPSHTRPLRPFLTQGPTRLEAKTLVFSGTSLPSAPSSLLVRNRGGRGRKRPSCRVPSPPPLLQVLAAQRLESGRTDMPMVYISRGLGGSGLREGASSMSEVGLGIRQPYL